MIFYKRLAKSVHESSGRKSRLMFVSPEPVDVTSTYLDQQNIDPYKVVSTQLKNLDISGTPTLLIVDGAGQVKHAFGGKLSESNETIVLKLIDRLDEHSKVR